MLGEVPALHGTCARRRGSAWDVGCTQSRQTFCILGERVAFSQGDAATAPGGAELFEVAAQRQLLCVTQQSGWAGPTAQGSTVQGVQAPALPGEPPGPDP